MKNACIFCGCKINEYNICCDSGLYTRYNHKLKKQFTTYVNPKCKACCDQKDHLKEETFNLTEKEISEKKEIIMEIIQKNIP